MSFLQTRIKEQLQLCLEFLGPNGVMLRNYDLLVIVEHVKNSGPSLRVYLQKTNIQKKVEQVEEQKLGSKVDLQKVKVEHVEKQKLGLKVDLQKVKVKHVKKKRDQHQTYKLKLQTIFIIKG